MNRQEKELVIQSLRDSFLKSKASFLVGYRGLTVAQVQALRKELRQKKGKLQVAKARLMKRAVQGLEGIDALLPYFKDQIGLVFASDESESVAKVLYEFSKANEALSIVVGCMESQLMDKQAVVHIASLPSKDVLLGQMCRTIKAPISNFVYALGMMKMRLLWALKQIEQKKKV